tara:strand:- start:104 stop:346 length:243 start_codon:yes stop_codon:yes gene_type:complete
MTEKEILMLGFERHLADYEAPFYYYSLEIVEGLSFITQADDEVVNGEWEAEIFDTYPAIKFKDAETLSKLIEILNKNKNK